ncbi:MAG: energy-coupling factor ABC transporter permease, partial [Acidobacteria bacterium]|nr:energy-coupling factor ABC transporter permease [Acidobacteriota bacterium]
MLGLVHIPDGFLSAGVAAASWTGAVVSVSAALAAERRESQPMSAGLLGALAAFIFAAQMVNVPVAPGTSGHLVGATLAALLVGPWRALLVMAVVLAIQALLFQDGGITAYGANLLDMGLAGTLAGYAVATLAARIWRGLRGVAAGGVVGA